MTADEYARRAVWLAYASLPDSGAGMEPVQYIEAQLDQLSMLTTTLAGRPGIEVLRDEWLTYRRQLPRVKKMVLQQRIVTEDTERNAALILSRLKGNYVRPGSVCKGMARDDARIAYALLYRRGLIVRAANGSVKCAHERETEAILRKRRELYGPGNTLMEGMEHA